MAGLKPKTNGMHNTNPETPPSEPNPGNDPSNLDRVRDILFGNQARDLERKFVRLEERLGQELSELRRELLERLGALETHTQQEQRSLEGRISNEAKTRLEMGESQVRHLEAQRADLERQIGALRDQLGAAEAALRSNLLEQSNRFGEELRNLRENNRNALEREASELRHAKTDRIALANLFAEMAAQLGSDG